MAMRRAAGGGVVANRKTNAGGREVKILTNNYIARRARAPGEGCQREIRENNDQAVVDRTRYAPTG
jgi:hypothetical protein